VCECEHLPSVTETRCDCSLQLRLLRDQIGEQTDRQDLASTTNSKFTEALLLDLGVLGNS
jgi:hypothetical protein